MPRVIEARIDGWPELDAALRELGETFGQAAGEKAIVDGLKEACKPVVAEAKSIGRSLGIPAHVVRSIRIEQFSIYTGGGRSHRPSKIAGAVRIRAYGRLYPLFEFGTVPRFHKSGHYTGQMTARPSLRPAWEHNRARVTGDLAPFIWKHIALIARKRFAKTVARLAAGKTLR
jgi:hypothetical protein